VNVGGRPALRIFRSIRTPFIARKDGTIAHLSRIPNSELRFTSSTFFGYEELSDIASHPLSVRGAWCSIG
jgi:hypothetical protein